MTRPRKPHILDRLRELVRYFWTSLVALAADTAIFSITLRQVGLPWPLAATVGFVCGMGVAYVLSIRYVFKHRALTAQPRRELLVFAFIGILGLGLTQLILWVTIDRLTLPPELSKLLAAGVTFFFNYFLRKLTLFSERPPSLRQS